MANVAAADAMDPLDAYMASLSHEDGGSSAAPTSVSTATTAAARSAARSYRGRQFAAKGAASVVDPVVRNRRFTRLQHLIQLHSTETSDQEPSYFSDELMQQRSPALFHLHLGQYLNVASRQQRAAFGADGMSLSAFLMATCDRQVMEARRVAEQRTWGAYHSVDDRQESEQEEEEGEEEEEEVEEETKSPDVSLDERRALLVELMSQRFLDGLDSEFVDYAAIDTDETLDDMDQMQRDAEDRYFADDD